MHCVHACISLKKKKKKVNALVSKPKMQLLKYDNSVINSHVTTKETEKYILRQRIENIVAVSENLDNSL